MKPLLPLFFLALWSCESAKIKKQGSLADKVLGTYIGEYKFQETIIQDYEVTVAKISDNKIQIFPKDGQISSDFIVELEERDLGSTTVIFLNFPYDQIKNNGSYAPKDHRLTYNLHLGGSNLSNYERFAGNKK